LNDLSSLALISLADLFLELLRQNRWRARELQILRLHPDSWIHEFGHGFGLPGDDAYFGPKSGVYWNGMPDPIASGDHAYMIAWNMIALGWVPPNNIHEVLLGETQEIILDPIENPTNGTLVVKIVKDPEHYWLVEARRPIGVDAGGETLEGYTHPPIDGVLVTRIVQPLAAEVPLWVGLRIYWTCDFLVNDSESNYYFDEDERLRILVTGEAGFSYRLNVSYLGEKGSSEILFEVSPDKVTLGNSVDLSGSIFPKMGNVELNMSILSPQGSSHKEVFVTSQDGYYNVSFLPDFSGIWNITISWNGNDSYHGAETKYSVYVDEPVETIFIEEKSEVTPESEPETNTVSEIVIEPEGNNRGWIPGFPLISLIIGLLVYWIIKIKE